MKCETDNSSARRMHVFLPVQTALTMVHDLDQESEAPTAAVFPPKERLTQILAVEACLSSGVPLNALDNPMMKDFIHHLGGRLPGARHLSNYIPFIEEKEVRPWGLDSFFLRMRCTIR